MKNLTLALILSALTLILGVAIGFASPASEICVASFAFDNNGDSRCTAVDALAALNCSVGILGTDTILVCNKFGCERVTLDDYRSLSAGAVCACTNGADCAGGDDSDSDSHSDSDSNSN